MTSSYKDIENFKDAEHLYINKKPNEDEINLISELSEMEYQNKHQFTQKYKELQKKFHMIPRQSLIYLTSL